MRKIFLSVFVPVIFLIGCSQPEIILENLSQKDANHVYVVLREQNIEANKISHKERQKIYFTISVKKQDAPRALRFLVENKIPKTWRSGLPEVFPPGSSNIIPTKSDESAKLHMAMQGEIESLLKLLPGIMDAKVVLAITTSQQQTKLPPIKSASVTTLFRPLKDSKTSPMSNQEIRALVASAIDGLESSHVTVLQKIITPVNYISHSRPIAPIKKSGPPIYILLVISILALGVAAYAVVRFLMIKNFYNNPHEGST